MQFIWSSYCELIKHSCCGKNCVPCWLFANKVFNSFKAMYCYSRGTLCWSDLIRSATFLVTSYVLLVPQQSVQALSLSPSYFDLSGLSKFKFYFIHIWCNTHDDTMRVHIRNIFPIVYKWYLIFLHEAHVKSKVDFLRGERERWSIVLILLP